ncbi:MAG: DUF1893 domain-containing protein [Ruminococcaceae bacterium]|nr:DUF1893 domain-containing protein [Oscillospiraceae bacterium]
MKNDLIKAKELLVNYGYTCVLCCGDKTKTSSLRGVKPLVDFYNCGDDFDGWSAADKVVGKATAYLYVLLGIKQIYAGIISKEAYSVLTGAGICVEYGERVEYIINRRGDGMCPFENAVMNAAGPREAYGIIVDKMKEMNL